MATGAKRKTRASTRSAKPPPSRGGQVCRWIERFLVHAEGDWLGQPFRLTDEQRLFIWRAYEQKPDGQRRYKRVVYGRPKGYGKTELAAALALAELAGPTAPLAPDIPVAAASFEQANLLFGAAKTMVEEGPLKPFLEVYETEILRTDSPGRLYRVAAVAGTNDGGRHSFRVADEVHEWEGRKERVHLVLTNGLAKRQGAWALDISTAGSDKDTLLGRIYDKGQRVQTGELTDERLLFDWIEHPDTDCDLTTEAAVREAVEVAYRDAGPHVNVDEIIARFYEIPEFEWRRYYLNQFTATPDRWLPAGAWQPLADPERTIDEGAQVVLGFDGSYNGDSTALVGCTLDDNPHVFVVDAWERPDSKQEWTVPREEVRAAVKRAMERWQVRELACDPPGWHREVHDWEQDYGSPPVVAYDTNRRSLMSAACSSFYTAVITGALSHDGDPRLARHLANAVVKETPDGAYITKEHRNSPRKIDLAVAAIVAHHRASEADKHEFFLDLITFDSPWPPRL